MHPETEAVGYLRAWWTAAEAWRIPRKGIKREIVGDVSRRFEKVEISISVNISYNPR
jgi:hypothetical protein